MRSFGPHGSGCPFLSPGLGSFQPLLKLLKIKNILGCAGSLLLWVFSSVIEWGLLLVSLAGFSSWRLLLLWSAGSRCEDLSACSTQALIVAHTLWNTSSVVVARGLGCSAAFPEQGSSAMQVDSQPLEVQPLLP